MQKPYGFPHTEKLKSVVRIEQLFTKGRSFWTFPCTVYYRIGTNDEIPSSQILVSVGKHYFKHAVDRNRMKRLLREAYRLHKKPMMDAVADTGLNINIGLVYKSHQLQDFAAVEASMVQILSRLEGLIRRVAASKGQHQQ